MNVRELRIILAHLPDDLPVHIEGAHVVSVERTVGGRNRRGADYWPPCVMLRGGARWFNAEPGYRLCGPYRRKAEMLAELDALEGAPVLDDPT